MLPRDPQGHWGPSYLCSAREAGDFRHPAIPHTHTCAMTRPDGELTRELRSSPESPGPPTAVALRVCEGVNRATLHKQTIPKTSSFYTVNINTRNSQNSNLFRVLGHDEG